MRRPDLNIIVCVDPRRCLRQQSRGRSSEELLQGLKHAVQEQGLEEQVQVTPCCCIFGCTYGPRIDVARRWSGEKVLYGTVEGATTISRRGAVEFLEIPEDLLRLVQDNLPER
jgi:hypothetical protein